MYNNPIVIGVNTTNPNPGVSLVSEVSGRNLQFTISIKNIIEINQIGEVSRNFSLVDFNFTLIENVERHVRSFNYSTKLDNGAYLSMIVSFNN